MTPEALKAVYQDSNSWQQVADAVNSDNQIPPARTTTGEWTHEKLQGLLQISNEDRYVADHAFENTLDEIKTALAVAYLKGKQSERQRILNLER